MLEESMLPGCHDDVIGYDDVTGSQDDVTPSQMTASPKSKEERARIKKAKVS